MKVWRFVFLSSIMDKCGCFCDFFSFNSSSISPLNCFSVAMIFAAFFAYILFPQSGGTFKAFVENVKADGTA